MRRAMGSMIVLLLLACSASQQRRPEMTDTAAIRKHIDSVFRACVEGDRDVLARLRAAERQDSPGAATPGTTGLGARVTRWSVCELDVWLEGDLAVATYLVELTVQSAAADLPVTLRRTDVLRRDGAGWIEVAALGPWPAGTHSARTQQPDAIASIRAELLADREAVWRAYFENDVARLSRALPEELIAINANEPVWADRNAILQSAKAVAAGGVKLLRLEFPRTEIQVFGETAILYTTYLFELDKSGERTTVSGRGTEVFVRRSGEWVNVGWHLDSGS